MGRVLDAIPDQIVDWLEAQPLFFVATAPSVADGHVNVSPKGYDTFRVLGPIQAAYLELTGSGAETIAHVRDNGRLTLMFCSFDEKPNVIRVYGTGRAVLPDDAGFAELRERFPAMAGVRAIIVLDITRVSTSCASVRSNSGTVGVSPAR